jgi:hypothetical protein
MRRFLVAAVLVALGGCKRPVSVSAPDMAFVPAFAAHDKVDLLFMIDDSPGIPYEHELLRDFPELLKALDDAAGAGHPASYHIGVVSSDLGAGPYTLNQGQCHPDGDGGKLQIGPAASAILPGGTSCNALSLGGGVRFIDYDQIAGTTNIVGAPDVPTAFTCMASLGSAGCGFEHQLESPYRALHDDIPENAGFLRDDALLVVFFSTDEDDCSAPPDGDLFDPSPDGVARYGVLHSFRCTQFGISCSDPPAPLVATTAMGPFDQCRPLDQADGGKLFDVQRYIDFFARPGGVKADPSDVILAMNSAPPTPVGWSITMPCADQVKTPSCPILNHSCVAPTNAQFFGDPAVRLSVVIDAGYTSQRTSICDPSYTPALDDLAQKIIARLK